MFLRPLLIASGSRLLRKQSIVYGLVSLRILNGAVDLLHGRHHLFVLNVRLLLVLLSLSVRPALQTHAIVEVVDKRLCLGD